MIEASFAAATSDTFSAHYPERPFLLEHRLVGHDLLDLSSLVQLAQRIRPVDVEYNRADLPIGIRPEDTPANGLSVEETIRSIETCGSWMVLKFVEQDAAYRQLIERILAEIAPFVQPATGPMLKLEGFIFISSPHAVTPFHFDPEHNILLQIRGSKTMRVFTPGDERFAPAPAHESFHSGGHRNLPWSDNFADQGQSFALEPGRGLYVPVKAPHFVENGPDVSISFSLTWRSEWSFREEQAHRLNGELRRLGLSPSAPGRFPHQNHVKSFGYRLYDKARRTVRRQA